MNKILLYILSPSSVEVLKIVWMLLRVAIGILTMILGFPKMTGIKTWHNLGVTFMYPLGIHFLPTLWGFMGGITQFFGGLLLAFGFATRLACFALVIMMSIAVSWHLNRRDSYQIYSFPLSLIFVYVAYFIVGAGIVSLDSYLITR